MTHVPNNDDEFAERIAKVLRAPESAHATFEARAMSAVHAARRAAQGEEASQSWWLRPRSFRLTPLAALAVAAGFAAIVLAGGFAVEGVVSRGGAGGNTRQVAAHVDRDTVHIVRFLFVDSMATRVALVGAFNQWRKDAVQLQQVGTSGVWSVDIPLVGGRYEYAFVVFDRDGERWVADRFAPTARDEFGAETSVISLTSRGS